MSSAPATPEGRAQAALAEGMHPIAAEAAALAEASSLDGGRVRFSDQDLSQLEDGVRALAQAPELEHALKSLVAMAAYLDEDLGEEQEALRLLEVAATGAPALQRQKADRRVGSLDVAERATGALSSFSDRSAQKRAPLHDGASKGGLSLKSLLPRGRVTGR